MKNSALSRLNAGVVLAVVSALTVAKGGDRASDASTHANTWAPTHTYIVQSRTSLEAHNDAVGVGAKVLQDLPIIHGVTAELSDRQVAQIRSIPETRVFQDRAVGTRGAAPPPPPPPPPPAPDTTLTSWLSLSFTDGTAVTSKANQFVTNFPFLVGADLAQARGITGKGITIAVLDTGLWMGGGDGFQGRVLASYDVINGGKQVSADPYGHGTHVTSIAAGSAVTKFGTSFGVAPGANLVIVRAFDTQGAGSYSNVIAGLNWIVANQQKYRIRVLNLSFGAPPQSNYWDDPLNQAVMAAWKAGIVVVVSAGNEGPDPMTIGVPGNVPYVITAGAISDNYTPYNPLDDRLASFSSTGPTFEGFVKPEIVAPGGHMVGSMWYQSYLANIDPGSMRKDQTLFTMSGTSQAAAVTSGVVALMLQANPSLTPDTIKCRLLASASPATTSTGALAYSVFQQGAGLINASNAINSTATGCANQGLDVAADLAGTQHSGVLPTKTTTATIM
jgi:subtilisin family serine protease